MNSCFVPGCKTPQQFNSRHCKKHRREWNSLALKFKNRIGKCQECGSLGRPGAYLSVHHLRYIKGHYFDEDLLQVLCGGCHSSADKARRALINAPPSR